MSIAANAPWPFIKLRRSGMLVRRFMESLFVLRACIVTMNRFEKLRRSAMSIAAADPDPLPSSVGAACLFVGSWRASLCSAHAL